MNTNPRPRKPVSAARIELRYWFVDEPTYRAFYEIPLGRKSRSVSDREWVLPVVAFADGHVEATYRFTHTCRNDGAQRGDSEKFFKAVLNAAGLDEARARLIVVNLLSREKFADPGVLAPVAIAEPSARNVEPEQLQADLGRDVLAMLRDEKLRIDSAHYGHAPIHD